MEKKVLATVNGVEITQKDLNNALMRVPAQQRGYFSTEQGKKQLLDQMIQFELIYNNAKDNNEDNEEFFLNQLEMIKKDALIQYSIQKMLSGIEVTDDEIVEFYDKNKDSFKKPATVTARHILVKTEEEAKKIAKEIKDGLSFEKAAEKYSTCPSKAQGGNLGSFSKGQMVPEFEAVAFELEPGILSEPVKTQFGYHLIEVQDKKPSLVSKFDEVKDMIKNKIIQEKQNKKYLKKLEELKNKYNVEMK